MTNVFPELLSSSPFATDWQQMRQLYYEYERHFSGAWLEDTESDTSDKLMYPLQFNVFELPVVMHTSFLFGEVPDGAAGLVTPEIELWNNGEKSASQTAIKSGVRMTQFINAVIDQNHIKSKMAQLAIDAQVFGGAVVGGFYAPERELDGDYPIMVKRVDPDYFYPVWAHDDYDKLVKALVAYTVSGEQAQAVGVEATENQYLTYVERWDRNNYSIKIEDKVVDSYGAPATGVPIANVIPYVYIPHPPRVGFYGRSLLHNKFGLAKEINARMVDVGDVVASEAMNIPAIRNTRQAEVKWIGRAKPVLDLGFQQGDRVPEIMYPTSKAVGAESAWSYVSSMLDRARCEAYCPPVIFGMGDGSQRSAASLALEAIPLVAHIREERTAFTAALSRLFKNILRIAADKGMGNFSMEQVRQARVRINWYPVLPRDVLEETTSIINRVQAKILSPETAIEKVGDVLDIQGELTKIKEWLDEQKPELPDNPFEGTGANGELGGVQAAIKSDRTQGDNQDEQRSNDGQQHE